MEKKSPTPREVDFIFEKCSIEQDTAQIKIALIGNSGGPVVATAKRASNSDSA